MGKEVKINPETSNSNVEQDDLQAKIETRKKEIELSALESGFMDAEEYKKAVEELRAGQGVLEEAQLRLEQGENALKEREKSLQQGEEELRRNKENYTNKLAEIKRNAMKEVEGIIGKIRAEEIRRAKENKNILVYADNLAFRVYNSAPYLINTSIRNYIISNAEPIFRHLGLPLRFDGNNQYVTLSTNTRMEAQRKHVGKYQMEEVIGNENLYDKAMEAWMLCVGLTKYGISAEWLNKARDYIFYHVEQGNSELVTQQFQVINQTIINLMQRLENDSKSNDAYSNLGNISERLESIIG